MQKVCLPAGIHQHETTGPVSGFHHTRVETALAEKGSLLISGDPGDGNSRIQDCRFSETYRMTGRHNIGKEGERNTKAPQDLVIPFQL